MCVRAHGANCCIRAAIMASPCADSTMGIAFAVVALVDLFAQHCHRVEILGESWRDKHRLDTDRPAPPPSRSRRKRT